MLEVREPTNAPTQKHQKATSVVVTRWTKRKKKQEGVGGDWRRACAFAGSFTRVHPPCKSYIPSTWLSHFESPAKWSGGGVLLHAASRDDHKILASRSRLGPSLSFRLGPTNSTATVGGRQCIHISLTLHGLLTLLVTGGNGLMALSTPPGKVPMSD
jgi:hypothetical protein